jgi:hypothetical protein
MPCCIDGFTEIPANCRPFTGTVPVYVPPPSLADKLGQLQRYNVELYISEAGGDEYLTSKVDPQGCWVRHEDIERLLKEEKQGA